ncbi:unnamed protein product (mitochondrion) [Plasmodiophora brassicae]|uniref:Chitin-binding type-4 domain-containing protein n=1 Tax=Plasmodiophora brassicae TaxID=37360 RepID=A0A3P3YHY8_PLABS|nr:unnamed protein product [Plasmodiophora brassicae]
MLARVTLLDIFCVERGTEVQSHLHNIKAAGVLYCQPGRSDPAFVCRVSTPQPPQALLTISTPIYLDFVWTGTPPSATDDCALYLSYSDVSLPLTSMQWFKVANLGDCGQTLYPFNVPDWLPSCDHCLLRWEWVPNNATFFANCIDVTIVGLVNATLPDASFMYPIGNQLNFTSDVILGPAVVTDDTPGVWGHGRPTTIVPPSPPNLPPETDVTTSSDSLVYSVVWVMAMLMVVVLSRCVLHAYRVRKQRRQHDLMRQHLTVVVNRHTSDPDVQVPAQAFTIE